MLYNNGTLYGKQEEYIFSAEPYNQDIDIRKIASIQKFYEQNGYIPQENITEFLNWITYSARSHIVDPLENPMYSSMINKCSIAQNYNDVLLRKMGFNTLSFNMGTALGTNLIHALECVEIPTVVDGKLCNKQYMLDPTFRQFCMAEPNRFERYYEEPRLAVQMSTPQPGYFLNLTDEGRNFANDLIHYGYFEMTDQNMKTYFDAFSLYITPKEAYPSPEYIGRCTNTSATYQDYWNRMCLAGQQNMQTQIYAQSNVETPKEQVIKEDKKLLNKLKNALFKYENQYNIGEDTNTVETGKTL